jgi:hypothetical protein
VSNCTDAGGYWYNNTCNAQSEEDSCAGFWSNNICYESQEAACTATSGFWSNNTCYETEEAACSANSQYWYNNQCNAEPEPQGLPDLEIVEFSVTQPSVSDFLIYYSVRNNGNAPTTISTDLSWQTISGHPGSAEIPPIAAGDSFSNETLSASKPTSAQVDTDFQITESNEGNNTYIPK